MGAMIDTWNAELAVPLRAQLGEGPWWDNTRDRLMWVDIPSGLIHAHVPATRVTRTVRLSHPVGFVVGRTDGGYLAGTGAGLLDLDADLNPERVLAVPPDLAGERQINDGACDPLGRTLFGTVDPSGASTGTLWSLSCDGVLVALTEGVAMSNGLAFSPDARRLYFVDTPTQRVDSFSYDVVAGGVSNRRSLFRVPDAVGVPDGLAVDAAGGVWVAIWGAGEVWRVTPEGRHVATVRVPAHQTSSCAFGGAARERLYITTAREGRMGEDEQQDSLAGAVFVAYTGATGGPAWKAAVAPTQQCERK